MGLLDQELQELRLMNKQIMAGTIKSSEVVQRIAIYTQTEKRAKMILQSIALGAKFGASRKAVVNAGLLGGGTLTLDAPYEVSDMVTCKEVSKMVSRTECYDYSGESKHYDDCKDCEHFNATRKVMELYQQ